MRITFAVPILLLAACNVDNDSANDQVTVEYNEETAREAAGAVANEAEQIGGHIVNDVQDAGAAIENEVGRTDVDVDVDRDAPANTN